jgi:hypothetical protein
MFEVDYQNRVRAKVDLAPEVVGEETIVQHLQEYRIHPHGPFRFIEKMTKTVCGGPFRSAGRLLLIARIRRSTQARKDIQISHVFAHVDADQRLVRVEDLGESLCQFVLPTPACGQEVRRADLAFGIFQSRVRRIALLNFFDRFILPTISGWIQIFTQKLHRFRQDGYFVYRDAVIMKRTTVIVSSVTS